ncbi:hypothetical protein BTN49_2395 [Candidatus Enterovibrio escicola]|uniref:Uncharacterized protein n=1 Tax=Candidatus Enterovibrio escicola TaxID=1927127 RepID=A0A2A5T1C9_9GAMM|nr:hypothetical protein BTN49_2395 [Candidatus Enterovibrio escacola]
MSEWKKTGMITNAHLAETAMFRYKINHISTSVNPSFYSHEY